MNSRVLSLLITLLPAGLCATAQNFAPAVDQVSLMNLRFYEQSGGFMVEDLQLVFPPADVSEGSLTVTDAAGQAVVTIPLEVRRWDQHPAFAALAPRGAPTAQLNAAGEYIMTIRLGETVIGTLSYSLTSEGGDDPFNPQKRYARTGPWQSLAYLSAPVDDAEEALHLNYWISLRETGGANRPKIAVSVSRDGVEVARSASDVVASANDWQGFSHRLVKPDKYPFTASDLESADGLYNFVLSADGVPVKSFELVVSDGAPVPHAGSTPSTGSRPDFLTPRRINTSAGSSSGYFQEFIWWMESDDASR